MFAVFVYMIGFLSPMECQAQPQVFVATPITCQQFLACRTGALEGQRDARARARNARTSAKRKAWALLARVSPWHRYIEPSLLTYIIFFLLLFRSLLLFS